MILKEFLKIDIKTDGLLHYELFLSVFMSLQSIATKLKPVILVFY